LAERYHITRRVLAEQPTLTVAQLRLVLSCDPRLAGHLLQAAKVAAVRYPSATLDGLSEDLRALVVPPPLTLLQRAERP
jgi:hypothetical protein